MQEADLTINQYADKKGAMYTIRLLPVLFGALLAASPAHAVESIEIGTGARGENYYSVGGAICRMVNDAHPSECAIEPTTGSRDNLFALNIKDVEFAIVQADMQRAAYQGSHEIDGEYANLRSVASVYTEVLTVVTRAGSDIERFDDLAGRRVAAGSLHSGSRWTFRAAMKILGMVEDDLADFSPVPAFEGGEALCEGEFDALVMMTGHPSVILSHLGDICDIRIVGFDRAEVDAMTGPGAMYRHATIPAGTYPFAAEPISTIGTDATLVTVEEVPDALVDMVLMAIFGDLDTFRRQQHVIAPALWWDIERGAPLHPAAKQFYRERDPVQ